MEPISPTVVAALFGAVAGAVVSAVLTNLVRANIERRNKYRESRESLAAEATVVMSEVIADLGFWSSTILTQAVSAEQQKALSAYTRTRGRMDRLQIQIWRHFSEWYVRAAITQFARRVHGTAEKVEKENFRSQEDLQLALEWLHEAATNLSRHIADATGLQTEGKQQLGFLGFTRAVRKRRMDLARSPLTEPAPWESSLEIMLEDLNGYPEEKLSLHTATFPKIAALRCPDHRQAPHVKLVGNSGRFSIEVEGCCEKLGELAHKALSNKGATEA